MKRRFCTQLGGGDLITWPFNPDSLNRAFFGEVYLANRRTQRLYLPQENRLVVTRRDRSSFSERVDTDSYSIKGRSEAPGSSASSDA